MFTHQTNTTTWASITNRNQVRVMCDDGCENIIDYTMDFETRAEAEAHLEAKGFRRGE